MRRAQVTDTGIGVRDADKGKLFRPFGQLQSYSGGTGLGLHSVQQKAQQLGGYASSFIILKFFESNRSTTCLIFCDIASQIVWHCGQQA